MHILRTEVENLTNTSCFEELDFSPGKLVPKFVAK